jgi:hypothetical protein
MELRYGGIFDVGASSGIYQRLAVGKIAVQQPGASLMFAKDASGVVTADAQKALKAVQSIPATDPMTRSTLACLADLRKDVAKAKAIDTALAKVTTTTQNPQGLGWDDLVDNPDPKVIQSLLVELKTSGISCPE